MITFTKRLSEETRNGRAEVLLTPSASKPYPKDIESGIFVDPHFFRRGDIYVNNKDIFCRTLEEMNEARASKVELDWFERRLHNIVRVTEDLDIDISREDIKRVLDAEETLPKVGKWIEREEICRCLSIPVPYRRTRYSKHRKYYDFFIEFAMRNDMKYHQIEVFMSTIRQMYRFELYQRIVRKRICFSLNVDTMTSNDLHDLHEYFNREFDYMEQSKDQMEQIVELADKALPRIRHPKLLRNKKSNTKVKMGFINRIQLWLNKERETNNDPFKQYEIGRPLDEVSVIYLNQTELSLLKSHDYRGQKIRGLIRDLFIFQCLSGIRYTDLRYLGHDNIRDGVLTYRPQRKLYSLYPPIPEITLDRTCLDIIDRHAGEDREDRLFCCPHKSVYNKLLKVVFRDCGLDRMTWFKDKPSGQPRLVHLFDIADSVIALHTYHNNANALMTEAHEIETHEATMTSVCKSLIEMLE